MPDRAYAVQAKQQEWSQQEQSLKSIEQALNQFQVQENKLQRTVSELQALQHTTAQRVSSPLTPNSQPATDTHTFMHWQVYSTQQHSGRVHLHCAYDMSLPVTLSCIVSELQALQRTTARLMSSLTHHAYNTPLILTLSCTVSKL